MLPLLYLHGLSSGDFGPALEQFLVSGGVGLDDYPADQSVAGRSGRVWAPGSVGYGLRAVDAPHPVALVRAGAVFRKGKPLDRPTDIIPPQRSSDGDRQAGTEVA